MRIRKYIVFIGLLLSAWIAVVRAQDYVSVVCPGDTGVSYFVEGWENSTFEWTVEGGVITRHFGDSIIVDWPAIPGEYTITVQETSAYGCVGEMKSGVVLVSGPEIDLGEDTYICEGNTFEIIPEGDFASYLWHDGSTGPSYATDKEGWISVEVTDPYGCAISDSLYLSVYPLPVVDLGRDTSLCGMEGLVLDAGTDGEIYRWSTGDITQQITVYQGPRQEIWVKVENAYGCTNSDTINIIECNTEFYFRDIPNAITANEDGVNDVWNIEKLESYPQAVVEIFDQWGTLVWRSEPGYSLPWDGKDMHGNYVPVDSYHFVIELNDRSKDRVVGIVTVIR
jgi:gliding motility-associated-like protein